MSVSYNEKELEALLLEWGLVNRAGLEEAEKLRAQARRGRQATVALADALVKLGLVTSAQVKIALASVQAGKTSNPGLDEIPVDVMEAQSNPANTVGKYVLLEEVGRGGAAVVRKAWDGENRRYVALKFLRSPEGRSIDAARIAELIREAQRAVQLRHPNIRAVYEVGSHQGQYFLAMEYLEGYTLAELVRSSRSRRRVSPFFDDPAKYLTLARDVARAIQYAHARTPPIIHCDLKPANVFIELNWRPYVVDFGVARELKPAGPGEEGTLKGSPAYMAPEQVLGKPDEIDVRTDVYGIGAILYELLAGRPPFTGELQEVLDKNLLVPPPAPTEVLNARSAISDGTARVLRVPPEVEAVCMKCLEKEKSDRFATAGEIADALTTLIRQRPVTQKPETTRIAFREAPRRSWRWPGGRQRLVAAAGGLVLLVGAVAAWTFLGGWAETVAEPPHAALERDGHELAARLDLEEARKRYQEAAPGPDRAAWRREREEELEWLRNLRAEILEEVRRRPPSLQELKLRDGRRLRGAHFVLTTESRVAVKSDEGRADLRWGDLDPEHVLWIFKRVPNVSPRARLGAAVFAIRNRLRKDAEDLVGAVRHTVVDEEARRLERELPKIQSPGP